MHKKAQFGVTAALIVGALLAVPVHARSLGLSDLPPEARLPGMKLNFAAMVVGTHTFKCSQTDVAGQFGWYLVRSTGSLSNAKNAPLGETAIDYSGAPIIHTQAVWQDASGATIVSSDTRQGAIPGAPDLQWRRYHILSTTGAGALANTTYVVRISAWKVLPYSAPCNKGHAGEQVSSSFQAIDLFTFGVLPPPD